ncbi:MAG: hypothetical protein ACLFQS_06195 [Bacteroidales bacterium]
MPEEIFIFSQTKHNLKHPNSHTAPSIHPANPGSKGNVQRTNQLSIRTSKSFYSTANQVESIYASSGQKTEQCNINSGRPEDKRQYAFRFYLKFNR